MLASWWRSGVGIGLGYIVAGGRLSMLRDGGWSWICSEPGGGGGGREVCGGCFGLRDLKEGVWELQWSAL